MRKAQMITYGFKPYYNWNTFNTFRIEAGNWDDYEF